MASPDLHENAWERAKASAAEIYRTWTFGIAVSLVGLPAAAFALLLTDDPGASTAAKVAVIIITGALAVALCLLFVLAVQLGATPVRQRNELRDSWPTGPIESPPNVGITLRNYVRVGQDKGDSLANAYGYSTSDEKEVEDWTDQVTRFLTLHGDEDKARSFLEASSGTTGLTDKVRRRTEKLRQIADDLG